MKKKDLLQIIREEVALSMGKLNLNEAGSILKSIKKLKEDIELEEGMETYKVGDEIPYTKARYKKILSHGYSASVVGVGGGYSDTSEFGSDMNPEYVKRAIEKGKIDVLANNADIAVKGARDPKMKGRKFFIKIKGTPINESTNDPLIIADLRNLVNNRQMGKVKDPVTKKLIKVDMNSANAIVQVYDALSEKNKASFVNMPLLKMVNIAWKLTRK